MSLARQAGLFISQRAIGDAIAALPLLSFLERLSGEHVHVTTPESLADIFLFNPNVSQVLILPDAFFSTEVASRAAEAFLPSELLSTRYDVVVDTMSVSGTAALVSQLDAPIKAGIGFDGISGSYTHVLDMQQWLRWSDNERTATDYFSDIVRTVDPDFCPGSPRLHVGDAYSRQGSEWIKAHVTREKPVVAFNPGAGSALKRWSMDKFIKVAAQLEKQGYAPLFIFGPKESALLESAAAELRSRGWATWVSSDFRVQPLAGLLSHCAFTLTNDCAVMHVSAAIGTPTAALFGPTHSKVWFPYSRSLHVVIENKVDCRSTCLWGCDERRCLDDITEKDVLARLGKWLIKRS